MYWLVQDDVEFSNKKIIDQAVKSASKRVKNK
jgi:ribosomal protein S17E